MAIIATFQNVDASNFNINGRNAPKIFNCIKLSDTRLAIVNVFDNSQELFRNIAFDEIEVDGVVYGSLEALVTAINPVIYAPASVQNVSQSQLNAIQAIIDDLPNLYADINHLHEGVYLTEQEILNLIASNPQASEIASAEIVGVQLRFLNANSQVLFSVNASPFFSQGNLLQFNPDTGRLQLRNQFFTLLSEVTIEAKAFNYDVGRFITGLANDLSNIVIEDDFYFAETTGGQLYFVNASNLDVQGSWRLKVIQNNFSQDLQNPNIDEPTYKAYEIENFDTSNLQPNELIPFNFWRNEILKGGASVTEIVNANYIIQSTDHDLLILPGAKIKITFPVASANQGRELRLVFGENVAVTPNLDLIKVTSTNSVIYGNTTADIETSSGQELSLRIKSINWRGNWEWVITQNELIS